MRNEIKSKSDPYYARSEPQEPTTESVDDRAGGKDTIERHPAYAQIVVNRVSGGAYLYGSDFRHQHYITIQIHASSLRRQLSGDYPMAHERLIEIAVSEAQWAMFVSSLNQGSGVQCTLGFTPEAGLVPPIVQPKDRKLQFSKEMTERFDMATKALADLAALIDESPLSNKKKDTLKRQLQVAERNLAPNMDFVASQFDEHMERTVEKAKSEVNAYAQHTLGDLAKMALKGGAGSEPLLLESPDEDVEGS